MSLPMRDVAVIGMACRFPNANTPEELFESISRKDSGFSEIPMDRFNIDAFYHPDAERLGSINHRGGHFLKKSIKAFDAPFFSVTPAQAAAMDPHQRLLLECVYEGFESAGIPKEKLIGSDTSCFVGNFVRDYKDLRSADRETTLKHSAPGSGLSMLSARISHAFDLRGTSVTIDTACSGGLTALHQACQNLSAGESRMAVVAAANLIFSLDNLMSMSCIHFSRPDSKRFTYNTRANGHGRGEGIAAIILKPLSHAVHDNDIVRAVIRGVGSNHDGRTQGITSPSLTSQITLIQSVFERSHIHPSTVGYVEAHGTGTSVGDPIEARSIGETLGRGRTYPLYVGSVKTNIGHTEATSGLAAIIKTIVSLERGQILPNLNFDAPNTDIDFAEYNMKVPTETIAWPSNGVRRASVNSFACDGTNTHVLLEDAYHCLLSKGYTCGSHLTILHPSETTQLSCALSYYTSNLEAEDATPRHRLYLVSANDEGRVEIVCKALARYITKRQEWGKPLRFDDLAYTLCQRRSQLAWRRFITAGTQSDLITALLDTSSKPICSATPGPLTFIFTGQDAQWWAMGRELLGRYDVFSYTLILADDIVRGLGADWSLLEELKKDKENSNVNKALVSQPLCTAIQIGLVDLLFHFGLVPSKVIGHSSGEIAAAYTAGALTLTSAMTVAYYRGFHSARVKNLVAKTGAMMAVGISAADARAHITRVRAECGMVDIACINSSQSVTISGDEEAVSTLHSIFTKQGTFAKRLAVDTAYHSHHMNSVVVDLGKSLYGLEVYSAPANAPVQMISTVTGSPVSNIELGPDYWVRGLVSTVQFYAAAYHACMGWSPNEKIIRRPIAAAGTFVEIGPHQALQDYIKQILSILPSKNLEIEYHPSLLREKDACECILNLCGSLSVKGYNLNLDNVNCYAEPTALDNCQDRQNLSKFTTPRVLHDLPSYPWDHDTEYWHESRLGASYRFQKYARHDLLGAPVRDWNPLEPRWRHLIRLHEQLWVKDYEVKGSAVYPAAGYICMAIEALRQLLDNSPVDKNAHSFAGIEIRELTIRQALLVLEDQVVETVFSLLPLSRHGEYTASKSWWKFRLHSVKDKEWIEHCNGLISHVPIESSTLEPKQANESYTEEGVRPPSAPQTCRKVCPVSDFYRGLDSAALRYGPIFQNIQSIQYNEEGIASGAVQIPDTRSIMPHEFESDYLLHPATFDGFLQTAYAALNDVHEAYVPTYIDKIQVSSVISRTSGYQFRYLSKSRYQGFAKDLNSSISIRSQDDCRQVVQISNAKFKALGCNYAEAKAPAVKKHCFTTSLEPDVDFISCNEMNKELMKSVSNVPIASSERVRELETVAYYYFERALNRVRVPSDGTIKSHLYALLLYMRHQHARARDRKVYHQSDDWGDFSRLEASPTVQAFIATRKHPDPSARLLRRVGEELPGILQGSIDPLAVLFKDDLLNQVYESADWLLHSNIQLAQYMSLLSHKYPNIKILEIGAGTGGTTSHVLSTLGGYANKPPRFQSYTFSDLSTGFFERARSRFQEWGDLVEYRTLNIEDDPIAQGYRQEYDVIIASNVLHATRKLDLAIANTRKLLKPGGKLVLLEITNPLYIVTLVFGTLSGWWRAEDDYRWNDGPTISEAQWRRVLSRNGFSDFQVNMLGHPNANDSITQVMVVEAYPEATHPGITQLTGVLQAPTPHSNPAAGPVHRQIYLISENPSDEYTMQYSAAVQHEHREKNFRIKSMDIRSLKGVDKRGGIFLCLDTLRLNDVNPRDFETIKRMLLYASCVLWVTRATSMHSATATGLLRVLRSEQAQRSLVTVHIEDSDDRVKSGVIRILKEAGSHRLVDFEYVIKNDILHVPRYIEDPGSNSKVAARAAGVSRLPVMESFHQPDRPLKLEIQVPGLLDTLVFKPDDESLRPLGPDEVEVKVIAVGMNFQDIMTAMGQIPNEFLGLDCAGTVSRIGSNVTSFGIGDAVVSWALGAYRTLVRNPQCMVFHIPAALDSDYSAAASIPTVYSMAHYSLKWLARLQEGETILIHSAAGGVGQAAIMLSKRCGAEIFATVGSDAKKQFVMSTYGIPEDHIFSSRNSKFAESILEATGGRGVDVVLNSLSGELLHASWECIAEFGRFVDISRTDIRQRSRLNMDQFSKNVSFASVDLILLFRKKIGLVADILREVLGLFTNGVIGAISPIETYSFSQIEEAFRTMQAGKIVGKVVVMPIEGDKVPVLPSPPGRISFGRDATYVIVGGVGGLGRIICTWMASRGAKHLILLSRSGAEKNAARELIEELRGSAVNVDALACDITDPVKLWGTLETATAGRPPIRGVIQGAMVLDDHIFDTMSFEAFMNVIRPKVHGSWNLHQATLHYPLDFFIMLSSLSGIIGNRSQANYAAGSTYQDALARYRITRGLPATTIDLGLVRSVGYTADRGNDVHLQELCFLGVDKAEFLALLELAMGRQTYQTCQLMTGCGTRRVFEEAGRELPRWFTDPRFALLQQDGRRDGKASEVGPEQSIEEQLPCKSVKVLTIG